MVSGNIQHSANALQGDALEQEQFDESFLLPAQDLPLKDKLLEQSLHLPLALPQ
uniref:hypothetical protein n=1 Tax=Pontibacter diazotrophicus TaxID=1400979 RepID=UPI0015F1B65D|nr:hypothetical protein [Pontibacter diazotrophicus]